MKNSSFLLEVFREFQAKATQCSLGVALAMVFCCTPASAQFVCGGSATGSIPISGSGSAAANQHDVAGGISSVAQGAATGTSGGATAYGFGAFALGANSTTIGSFSGASTPAAGVTSIGANANATGAAAGIYSTAIGAGADPNSGNQVISQGNYSVAIGGGDGVGASAARAMGNMSIAIGGSTIATGQNALAIGPGSSANFNNSAAFGNGATVSRANQQVFGTASNTYTMPGITSAASQAAQSGTTEIVTSDASGNLATSSLAALGLASGGDLTAMDNRISSMGGQIDDLYGRTKKAYTGVAMAFAMAGVPTLLPNERCAATVNYGTFSGTSGFAMNAAYRLGRNVQLTGGVGYGVEGGIFGGRLGLRIGF